MKIKQLKWHKVVPEDKYLFWYESNTKFPFCYCIEPNFDAPGVVLWNCDSSSDKASDTNFGTFPTKAIAEKFAQKDFEKNITKLYLEK